MLPLEAQDGGFVHIYIPSDGQVPMGLKDFTELFFFKCSYYYKRCHLKCLCTEETVGFVYIYNQSPYGPWGLYWGFFFFFFFFIYIIILVGSTILNVLQWFAVDNKLYFIDFCSYILMADTPRIFMADTPRLSWNQFWRPGLVYS